MAKQDRNMPAQQGNRENFDKESDERMRRPGEEERGIAADEDFEDTEEETDEEEEEDEGTF